jgi:exo-beta-1,3-glucanase (GH17 family)
VAGKDIVLPGYVLSVKKRDGSSLEGIHLVQSGPDGKETIITAETGTVTQGPKQTVEAQPTDAKTRDRLRVIVARNSVKLTLFNANVQTKNQSGTTKATVQKLELNF